MADLEVNFTLDEQPAIDADFSLQVVNTDHSVLTNRDLPDQHPIDAITGLREALDSNTAEWGKIRGNLSDQTDLQDALDTLQGGITANSDSISGIEQTIGGYGDIVTYNANDFASASQGEKADTALQPNDNISELTNDVGYTTNIGTVTSVNNILPDSGGNVTLDVVGGFSPYPNTWTTNGTVAQLMADVTADTSATKGMAYLGEVTCSDLPFVGNGEMMIYILDGADGLQGKVILATLTSGNVSPYYWQMTWWNNNGTWRSFIPTSNIDNTPISGSSNVVTSGGIYTALSLKANVSDIPTVNNATLTIQKNGTNVQTFTANADSDVTANITVPTSVSEISTQEQLAAINSGATTTNIGQIATNTSSISTINGKIPSAASSSNQLADKEFVNSSIASNTANFIGTFASITALNAYSGTVTNNDYAFVINSVVTDNGNDWSTVSALNAYNKDLLTNFDYAWVINGSNFDLYRFDIVNQVWDLRISNTPKTGITLNTAYNRYKATVVSNVVSWEYEYTLNNSSFTAVQWAAINSGITADDVALIGTALQPNDNISELTNDSGYITGITSTDVTTALGYTPYDSSNPNGYTTNVGTVVSINNISPDSNGNVTLSIPAAQVNSDWNAVSGVAQILNKPTLATVATSGAYSDLTGTPTIPTVNNATLTIQKNSTNVATFTANASSDVTANISVPTDTSDLTNNAGFITSSALSGYATETWVGQQGYITGINSSDVTTALGYTPYDSSNPNGYTSNTGTVTSVNNVSPVSGNVTLTASDVGVEAYTANEVQTLWEAV